MLNQLKHLGDTVLSAAAGASGKEAVTGGVVAVLGLLATLLGGWDKPLQILVVLMVADYITGILGAVKTKAVNSEVMFWGGIRKITILFVVGLAVLIDGWVGGDSAVFRTLAVYFYAGREGLSVMENLGILGVYIPPKIKEFLEQLNEKGEAKQ
ncbi:MULTISPECIES: phage holin family protein [Paenibacillus]|uniref:phage holin family protein n=1 Tax=Paenibacillus TaxID=44249 RepID=UPI0009FB58E4|nr:phage holin family protein [Paenibacillus lautus]